MYWPELPAVVVAWLCIWLGGGPVAALLLAVLALLPLGEAAPPDIGADEPELLARRLISDALCGCERLDRAVTAACRRLEEGSCREGRRKPGASRRERENRTAAARVRRPHAQCCCACLLRLLRESLAPIGQN